MEDSATLHELIATLSAEEKRYVRRMARLHSERNTPAHLVLFDTLCRMKVYDTGKLLRNLRSKEAVRHLPETKYYLQNFILKCLTAMSKSYSLEDEIRTEINHAELLFSRGLFEAAESRIRKAKGMCASLLNYALLLDFINTELKIVTHTRAKDKNAKIDPIASERNIVQEHLALDYEMKAIERRLRKIFRLRRHLYRQEERAEAERIIRLLPPEFAQLTEFAHKIIWLECMRTYADINLSQSESLNYSRLEVALWNAHENYQRHYPIEYRRILLIYRTKCLYAGRIEDIEPLEVKLNGTRMRFPIDEIDYLDFRGGMDFFTYLNLRQWDKLEEMVLKIKEWLSVHAERISPASRLQMMYNLGIYYFLLERFADSREWFNEVINMKKQNVRNDILFAARLLHIITLFEKGEREYLESPLSNFRRFLKDQGIRASYDEIILPGVMRLIYLHGLAERKSVYAKMLDDLTAFRDTADKEKNLGGISEVFLWLTAKIKGISIRQAFEEAM